jgi:cGMP-dependent protein kinase
MELNTRKIIDYSHITLENLVHMKKLGEGQFGRVYLVRESKGSPNMYALKCIKK